MFAAMLCIFLKRILYVFLFEINNLNFIICQLFRFQSIRDALDESEVHAARKGNSPRKAHNILAKVLLIMRVDLKVVVNHAHITKKKRSQNSEIQNISVAPNSVMRSLSSQ